MFSNVSEEHIHARMLRVVERFLNDQVVVYEDDAYALNSAHQLCYVHPGTINLPRSSRILVSAPVNVTLSNCTVANGTLQGFLLLCRDIALWECETLGPLENTSSTSSTSSAMSNEKSSENNQKAADFYECKVDPYELT